MKNRIGEKVVKNNGKNVISLWYISGFSITSDWHHQQG